MNRRSLIPDERDEHPPGLPQVRPALEGEYAVRGPNRALPELRHALRRPVAIGGRRPAQIEPQRRSSRQRHDLANSGSSDAIFAPLEDAVVPVHVTPVVDPPAAPPPLPPLEAPPRPLRADGPPCPECGEPMAGEAVVCLVCGFNHTTGKRLKTVSHRLRADGTRQLSAPCPPHRLPRRRRVRPAAYFGRRTRNELPGCFFPSAARPSAPWSSAPSTA